MHPEIANAKNKERKTEKEANKYKLTKHILLNCLLAHSSA